MARQSKYVTKSIRLTEDEARVLADLARSDADTESELIRRWVLHGMRRLRIDQAAAAYRRDDVDLRGGAALAGIPIGLFVEELADRRIPLIDDPDVFERELQSLRSAFGGEDLSAGDEPADLPDTPAQKTQRPRARRALSPSR
jgi:predicted HTH domain antitoxin